jgi:alpha-beta hydrolase superfamily lysophospholipase
MGNASWKAFERWVAKVTGGKRTGNSGRDTADVQHEWLAPECKYRAKLPRWLTDAMEQAERNARNDKMPCVWLKAKGDRYRDSLVVMRASEFVDRYIGTEGGEDEWPGK